MPTIKATKDGFHTLGPLGGVMAPNVFLNAGSNVDGRVVLDPVTGVWVMEQPGGRILLEGTPFEPGAGQAQILQVVFQRDEAGEFVDIGSITLDAPLSFEVQTDQGPAGPVWSGAVADGLSTLLRAEGYVFEGGDGDDVFAPARDYLPVYGPVTLLGRGGDDVLTGGRSDTVLRGGSGDDRLSDVGGSDRLYGGAGDDVIEMGLYSENSRALGGRGDDVVISGNGDDTLRGGAGADKLLGGRGTDALFGGTGDDRLDGGEGDDRLVGGAGDDDLIGGWGADVFVFRAKQAGADVIRDFDVGVDRIELRGLDQEDLAVDRQGDDLVISWNDGTSSVLIEQVYLPDQDIDFLF